MPTPNTKDMPVSGHDYELFETVKIMHVKNEELDKRQAPQIVLAKSGGYSGHEFMALYLSNGTSLPDPSSHAD